MDQRDLELRFHQVGFTLAAAVVGLIASTVLWFSVIRDIDDPWIEWPFRLAVLSFFFTVYDFFIPALELGMMVRKLQYPHLKPDEERTVAKEVYAGIIGFVVGFLAFLFVIYRLWTRAPM